MLAGLNRRRAICATGMGLLAALVAESCNSVPLFAPTESTITLTASRLGPAGNGDTELVATVIEQSGTPVHDGTVVTFTTTLGTIEPREAETNGGTATAVLRAGTQSGTATVSAFSGGTRAADITIEIGVTQTVPAEPVARFTVSKVLSVVTFNATTSTGTSLTYLWNFGDGSAPDSVSGRVVSHTYASGTYIAYLRVEDSLGRSGTTSNSVTVP